MRHRAASFVRLACLVLALAAPVASNAATWTNVDLSPYANWRLQSQGGLAAVPTGVTNFAGVPFLVNATGNNSWNADLAAGANPRVLDVAVSARSVTVVRVLLNSIWGVANNSYCTIAVVDSAGDVDSLRLYSGQHLRDYNEGSFATTLNGTTTVEGWNDGTCGTGRKRLDVFTYVLPAVFSGKRLTHVKLLDYGTTNVERAVVSGLTLETADNLAHLPIDLSSVCNWPWSTDATMSNVPKGSVDVAGVPITTPASGNDCWNANVSGSGVGTQSLTLKVKRYGVKVAHTMINTLWGQSGPTSYATVSFFYAGGVRYDVPLVGNADVRDYNAYIWTNSINNTTTRTVWNNGQCTSTIGHRLDMQDITLPLAYVSTRLDSIRFTDTGAQNVQRIVLHALTLDADASLAYVGVDDAPPAAPATLAVTPNPSRGSFRVDFAAPSASSETHLEVLDVRGRRVGHAITLAAGARSWNVSESQLGERLAPGLYFVHARAGAAHEVARVVVVH